MAALLVGLTTNIFFLLGSAYVGLRLRTISAGLATLRFGIALIGAIHKTADAYQRDKGLLYDSVLVEYHIGDYSAAQTMDHLGTGFGIIFLYLSWRRNSPQRPKNE